jgi:Zn-dependent metalloprotease
MVDGSDDPHSPVVFVDAHSGEVVFQYENLQTSCPGATGSGTAYYTGNVSIDTCKYSKNKAYYLESTTDDYATLSFSNTTTTISYMGDSDDSWTSASEKVAVQAHYNAGLVMDYYATTFGRNGIDDNGGPGLAPSLGSVSLLLTSGVSYSKKYNNAFWDSTLGMMVYGDGDGKTFNPLVSVDISGHEMTHGVVQYSAGLAYTGESGGLNEAYADIFGAMIERYADGNVTSSDTWTVGEDAYTPKTAGDALRYMNNPAKDGSSLDYYKTTAGKYDVHYSSGIANLAFYLLSEGGAHPTRGGAAMVGIGADEASEIWYRALTVYLTSASTFSDARNGTLKAAKDLYGSGSAEYAAVLSSWNMVGV